MLVRSAGCLLSLSLGMVLTILCLGAASGNFTLHLYVCLFWSCTPRATCMLMM